MKKNQLFLLAASFAAGLALSACSSIDDAVVEEGEGTHEQGVVKTEFTISFPKQLGKSTRQGLDIVQGQETPVFRGITGIKLFPFDVTAVDASTGISSSIDLPSGTVGTTGSSATAANAIAASGALFNTSKSHLYKDIQVPIGTRSFLFYGHAIDKETEPINAVNGALTETWTGDSKTLAEFSFDPVPIYSAASAGQQANDIAKYLTAIANVSVGEGDAKETTLTLFPNFTTLKTGSWRSVKAAVQQMYSVLYTKSTTLAIAIIDAITGELNVGTTEDPRLVTFATADKDGDNNPTGTLTFSTAYSYPQNVGLPDGAAYVFWNSNKFEPLGQDNMGMNVSALGTYVYPASLYYFGQSGIKTAAASMETYYNNDDPWATIVGKYDLSTIEGRGTVVQSTTRSIAIVKPVEYAVGRLDVTVKTKNGTTFTLLDNNDKEITVGSTDFPITGILVANQRAVDYKFEAKTGASTYTVYDSQVYNVQGEGENTLKPVLYPGASPSVKTHTLVLETPEATSDDDANANITIAVEFENTTEQTIVGRNNELIYPHTKFYMIGTLKPNLNTDKEDGEGNVIKKGFLQDYITTANFEVGSFKQAYNLLPDLRSPHLEIGMSVDLTWNSGITQTITID